MNLRQLISETAARYAIDDVLFAALILQESSLNQFAFRFESDFYKRYIEGRSRKDLGGWWPECDPHSNEDMLERKLRAASFGYCQIILQTARELGFEGLPSDLWDPKINLDLGARKLAHCFLLARKRSPAGSRSEITRAALLIYNGGANLHYPDDVLRWVENGRARQVLE